MTEAKWRVMLDEEHVETRDTFDLSAFWVRICHRIKTNTDRKNKTGEGECIGFDVITNSKGQCRIVDSTTQIPIVPWHNNYYEALQDLESSKVPK